MPVVHACCAQVTGEHNHDDAQDRSKGVPVKYQKLLEVRPSCAPPRAPQTSRFSTRRSSNAWEGACMGVQWLSCKRPLDA